MKKSILRSTVIILSCSVIAKILSYIWEATLAAKLGASDEADVFYMMLSIFHILYPILDIGIWKVFMPIYKKKITTSSQDNADRIANISIAFFFSLSIVLIAVLLFLARPLAIIIAPGFSQEKKQLTALFIRIASPLYLTMAVSSVLGAILQCHGKFFGSHMREITAHISKILVLLVFYRFFGIYAAVIAYIVGSFFRLIIEIPFIDWKWKFKLDFHFKDKDIVTMIKGLPSVAVTSAISHINGLVDKIVASGSVSGSISYLNYGHKLMNVFSGMISSAIGTAVYPTMIQYIAENRTGKLKELLRSVISALGFLIIPISCFCMLFSKEIVTVAFQRGSFDASATVLTAAVFAGYSLGMLFSGLSSPISNVFYGYGDTKITMYISMISIALNIVFNLIFIRFMGIVGLAYATSVSSIICLSVRFVFLRRYIRIGYKSILEEYIKILIISALSCGIPFVVFSRLLNLNVYLSLLLSALLCGGLYLSLSLLFKVKTLEFLKTIILKKLKR